MPSGLLLSDQAGQAARYLYVVNSNFDLRYNAGSLQAYDLDRLDAELSRCDPPGVACEIDPADVMADEVQIPSFATAIGASSNHDRLFVVTRDEPGLRVIDTPGDDDDALECGDDESGRCSDDYTRGDDPDQSPRRLVVPADPVSLVANSGAVLGRDGSGELAGEFVLVAHRGGQVSLFLEEDGTQRLTLSDVIENLPLEPTGIAFDVQSKLAYLSTFDRTNRGYIKRVLSRVGVAVSGDSPPASLYNAGALSLEGLFSQTDTRAVAINPAVAGEALVVGRSPSALLWANIEAPLAGDSQPTEAFVRDSVNVGAGPSRVTVGTLGDRTVAVVSCFDARQIFILDALSGELLSIVHNFSGPFEIALDSQRQRLYVGDFRASVVRVLDLAQIVVGAGENAPTARIIATLGHPQLVQELQ